MIYEIIGNIESDEARDSATAESNNALRVPMLIHNRRINETIIESYDFYSAVSDRHLPENRITTPIIQNDNDQNNKLVSKTSLKLIPFHLLFKSNRQMNYKNLLV